MNKKIKSLKKIYKIDNLYVGWGNKLSGQNAKKLALKNNSSFLLLEDGFIKSVSNEQFSIVKDDLGIYYDATQHSRLEKILKNKEWTTKDLEIANIAINFIKKYKISKYNDGILEIPKYIKNDKNKKILIIGQTKNDLSLIYGYANKKSLTNKLIEEAIKNAEKKQYSIYFKIHPEVLKGNKESNIDLKLLQKYKNIKIIKENINPILLLENFEEIYTQTSQMGFEALLLNKKLHIFGAPFYVGWNIPNIKWYLEDNLKEKILKRRGKILSIKEIFTGAYIKYSEYYNPYRKEKTNIIDVLHTVNKYREIYFEDLGNKHFYGFTYWKKNNIQNFFRKTVNFNTNIKNINKNDKIFIWGKKKFPKIEKFANDNNIPIYRIEDGFLRSVSLGSDLTNAYSITVDNKGIYFDPSNESKLEHILNNYDFDKEILNRAIKIKEYIIKNKLSKYNSLKEKKLNIKTTKKKILIVGQVEDDASIIYGGKGMTNLKLIQEVRKNNQNAFLIYKPHPDVVAGNRKGNIEDKILKKYVDLVVKDVSLPFVLEEVEEVHTITSLSGLEALIRGKKVYTYGIPFYAGWGLTIDKYKCERRTRKLNILELIAGTYIIFPRYISPKTKKLCEVEVFIKELKEMKEIYQKNIIYRNYHNIRNFIIRKLQLLWSLIYEHNR